MSLLGSVESVDEREMRKIVAGRGFFYAPAPFVSLKVTVDREYDHTKMTETLLRVEKAHPILNNIIVKNDDGLFFKDAGLHVKLIIHNAVSNKTWQNVLSTEVCKTVNIEEEPGVFVHIIDNVISFDILLICHHIYGDGVSVKQVMSDLLYSYSSGRDIAVREPMAGLSKWNMPDDYHVAKERKEQFYSLIDLWETRNTKFTFEDFTKLNATHHAAVGYGMEYTLIRGAQLRKLKGACKENNVTINSALTTAILKELQGESGAQAIVAANTRPLFGMESCTGMANFASALNTNLLYDTNKDFWDNTKEVNSALADIKQNKPQLLETLYAFLSLDEDIFGASYLAKYGLYMDMEVLMKMASALNVGSANDAFSISNLGQAQFMDTSEDYYVRDCCFVPNIDLGTDYKFGVISLENSLSISLAYASTKVAQERAQEILKSIVNNF